jgi:hypothetical protein
VLLAGLCACAGPAPKRGWDDVGLTVAAAPAAAAADGELPEDPGEPVATPLAFPPPPGGRLLASAGGPAAVAPAADLLLSADAVRPFLPGIVDDLPATGVLDLDVNGDGVAERVALAPLEGRGPAAVLVAFGRDGAVVAGWGLPSPGSVEPAPPGPPCHGEWSLAGSLAHGRARLPVVFEERGVGCGAFEGGGYDRRLLVFAPGDPRPLEALLARARLGAGGAADVHEAVAYAADRDGDGVEELWVRGISRGLRPCRAGDPPFQTEERAWRVIARDGTVAVRGREVTPLADGVLPATLLVTHPAACGAAAPPLPVRFEGTR